ncbi:MAG: MipA/OmpV family protein [Alphaproteobacteria bacterium]|nr:MipA/OmpV family protein [Alphaproteobacteria bacterium]
MGRHSMGRHSILGLFRGPRPGALPALVLALVLGLPMAQAWADSRYNDWELWTSSANAVLPVRQGIAGPFRINAAVGVVSAPEFLGSDSISARALPLLDVNYAGSLFLSTQQGIGWNMWRKRTFRAGPRITFDYGRQAADSTSLTGLPDIDIGTEAGLFFESFMASWRFKGDFRKDVGGGHGGLLINGEASWGSRWTKDTSLIMGMRMTYMDTTYAESYFSVSAANATSGRAAYTAAGGLRDVNAYAQLVYDFTPAIYLATEVRATALMAQAADSPLAEQDAFFTGAVMLGVRF